MSRISEEQRANSLTKLKKQLAKRVDRGAQENGLNISEDTKALIVDETMLLTHSPARAGLVIDRLLATQVKLASLHDPELLKERIEYAYALVAPPEPHFRLRAGTHASRILEATAGGSRGFEK